MVAQGRVVTKEVIKSSPILDIFWRWSQSFLRIECMVYEENRIQG